ncbi:MAG TPA: 23S rRNA (adenine(2030)-N(6))-methyltransferase RlmJ [Steroidobacteraceae bacterium]
MQYRHSFHAGTFADVHKHVALLALLAALKRKDTPFLYLETHAGRGAYDLAHPSTETSRAAHANLVRLAAAAPVAAELRSYLSHLAAVRARLANTHAYPGSPLLAARELRTQDRAVLHEIVPSEARALERELRGYARTHVEAVDGFTRLRAHLPPPERRSLVLIDPPYEERDDLQRVAAACAEALSRFPSGIVAAWYPIKDVRTTAAWLDALSSTLSGATLVSEWWLYPRDSRVSLNGSGLLILNPPYQFAEQMQLWLAELHALFNTADSGGMSIRTLGPPA